jgi:hypothetical protein
MVSKCYKCGRLHLTTDLTKSLNRKYLCFNCEVQEIFQSVLNAGCTRDKVIYFNQFYCN